MISVDDKSHMQCQYSHGLLPTFRIGGNANFQLEVRKKLMCVCLCVHVCESVCVCVCVCVYTGFSGGSDGKESACNAGDLLGRLGRSSGGGHGYIHFPI